MAFRKTYTKKTARDWAWQDLKGCANVIIPSYTADLKGINEKGVRHDVRKSLEHGFSSTLLVSETALTLQEYGQFFEIANDESRGYYERYMSGQAPKAPWVSPGDYETDPLR